MPKSMTGYGRATVNEADWTFTFEIKSVNGRYLDLKWRMPAYLRALESRLEKTVRSFASRGRVDVTLAFQATRTDALGMAFNRPLALAMIREVKELAASLGHDFTPDFSRLLTTPMLWQDASAEPDPGLLASLEAGLTQALQDWDRCREVEGAHTAEDMSQRLGLLRAGLEKLKERAPLVKAEKMEGLRTRISELTAAMGVTLPEERVVQEMAMLSDRLDVSEELTRLTAHLDRLAETLAAKGEVGKKLDFLLQETFREINTCGNKCQDQDVSRTTVDFKAELEKIREQVQNLE